ncbi:MAG: FAD-dependent oxidoreductase [Cyanobacteriota bacterium]
MSALASKGPTISVIGDGLAGSVLALCLAQRGGRVELIGAAGAMATALSYGALPRGAPSRAWRRLEQRHGPLGWRPSGLVVHGPGGGLAALTRLVPLPLARVDAPAWLAGRRQALAKAGVRQLAGRVDGLWPRPGGGWRLEWSGAGGDGSELESELVVLAAGAEARALWPGLPERLRHSWAGVLHLESLDAVGGGAERWLDQARRGRIVQPRHWRRPALEAASAGNAEPLWIVDAGLAPRGEGVVVGQVTLIPPAGGAGPQPPDPGGMERRLREGLAQLDPALAGLEAPYRQVPVSFCPDGQPLAGPVAEAPGLWVFAGFSAAFSRVPAHAEALARRLLP